MKIVDFKLVVDGMHLDDNQSVEDVIQHIRSKYYTAFEIQIEDLYEELTEEK